VSGLGGGPVRWCGCLVWIGDFFAGWEKKRTHSVLTSNEGENG